MTRVQFFSKGNKVLGVEPAPDGPEGQIAVILDKTICHPQGGGQPSDEGFLKQGDIKFNLEALSIVEDTILHIGKFEQAG